MNEALLDQGGMEPALFDAVIRPYRSLSRRGCGVLMTAVVVVATAICLGFAALGLWLVLPFFGGEVLFVYWAFRTSYRDRCAYEAVRLTVKALKELPVPLPPIEVQRRMVGLMEAADAQREAAEESIRIRYQTALHLAVTSMTQNANGDGEESK